MEETGEGDTAELMKVVGQAIIYTAEAGLPISDILIWTLDAASSFQTWHLRRKTQPVAESSEVCGSQSI